MWSLPTLGKASSTSPREVQWAGSLTSAWAQTTSFSTSGWWGNHSSATRGFRRGVTKWFPSFAWRGASMSIPSRKKLPPRSVTIDGNQLSAFSDWERPFWASRDLREPERGWARVEHPRIARTGHSPINALGQALGGTPSQSPGVTVVFGFRVGGAATQRLRSFNEAIPSAWQARQAWSSGASPRQ